MKSSSSGNDAMTGPYPPHFELILADPIPVASLVPTGETATTITTTPSPRPRKRERRQSPRAKALYPRKRATQACRTCRVRRTKCDNERPSCSSCMGMGIPCIYQSGDPSTFDPASLAILARLDGLEEHLRVVTAQVELQPPRHSQKFDPTSPSSFSALKDLQSPALERTTESIRRYINIEAVLSWPIFNDQGFDGSLDLKTLLLSNDKKRNDINAISVCPDFEVCASNELFRQFLDHVHIFNPVLEEPKVNEYMRHARFNGLGFDAQSCLLLLIYALGSITVPFDKRPTATSAIFRKSADFQQAESFFFAAQKRMGMLLCGSTVIEAQCFFLAGVYLMATLRPFKAWKMFVQALACCQGFYSPPRANENELGEQERHLQESVYWTCFKSELELRLELNISERGAWDLTYPTFFPSPPEGLRSQGEAVWYFYLAEIALRRLGNRILNYVYQDAITNTSQPPSDQITSNFEDQADGWLQSLPPQLKLDEPPAAGDAQNSQNATLRFILNGHLLDCYEMMYWPFVHDAIHGRLPPTERAREFARKGLAICVQRIAQNEPGFYHRHHGTWLMLRSCTRSAFVLVAAARCCASLRLSPSLLPEGWQQGLYRVLTMLRFWRDESSEVMNRFMILEQLVEGLGLAFGEENGDGHLRVDMFE